MSTDECAGRVPYIVCRIDGYCRDVILVAGGKRI